MTRLLKILLVFVAAFVGVAVVASFALYLFFDPNDFRENISAAVKKSTGRDMTIEGDLSLSVFPWIAVEIGRTKLGNAKGFGDEPFLTFDNARLSVRLLPLILHQEITVGTASLDALNVNLAVNKRGVSNWDDLTSTDDATPKADAKADGGKSAALDIAKVKVSNANVTYKDAQAGSKATVTGLTFETGRVAAGNPVSIDAEFAFELMPDKIGGNVSMSSTISLSEDMQQIDVRDLNVSGNIRGMTTAPTDFNFDARALTVDTAAEKITLGEMDMSILGISFSANVEPFSYAGDPQPRASIRVNEFSLKELMKRLDSEAPETSDPNALQKVSFTANAVVGKNNITLNDIKIALDDTSMDGKLVLPKTADGVLKFDLHADNIVVDHYMAPANEDATESASDDSSTVEIPVDLIRSLNANGTIKLDMATLTGIVFKNMQLTVLAKDGNMRLHPISADMFGGSYKGDIRIDASTDTPVLSVDENIIGVQMASLAKAMYDVENVDGTIGGRFTLSGRGADTVAIQKTLSGTMSFELTDGAYKGVDVWHQLRTARARLKNETPPAPKLPARTEFSSVSATGNVSKGVLSNQDFLADLPFLRITGRGEVNLVNATINYMMDAKVLDKPELARGLTQAEIDDFASVVIPLKVTGPLSSPSILPDVEGLLRREVEKQIDKKKDEITNRLMDKLLGGKTKPADTPQTDKTAAPPPDAEKPADEAPADEEGSEEQAPEDQLKDALKDIFGG